MTYRALVLTLALGATLTGGCVSEIQEAGLPCPCSVGWTCCEGECRPGAGPQDCGETGGSNPPPLPPPPDTQAPEAPSLDSALSGTPTNQLQVTLAGSSEPLATVRVYSQPGCGVAQVAQAVADSAGGVRVDVGLAENATRTFWATATDAAGNASLCSARGLAIEHDSVAPAVPVWEGVMPASPSPVATPTFSGSAEPGSLVRLFTDAACTLASAFEQRVDTAGRFAIWTNLAPNAEVAFSARAFDAAGNASACTGSALAYRHDDIPPVAPQLTALTPASPSRNRATQWEGTAEPGSLVEMFGEASCAEPVPPRLTGGSAGTWSFPLQVEANLVSRRWSRAVDAAGNRSECMLLGSFEHDDIPPPAVWLINTEPLSPNNHTRTPVVVGRGPPGTTVWLHGGIAPVRTVVDANGNLRAQLEVGEGTHFIHAQSVDAAGNETYAQGSRIYVYDTQKPAPPSQVRHAGLSPALGAQGVNVYGTTEPEATVHLYLAPDCTGQSVGTGTLSPPNSSSLSAPHWFTAYSGVLPLGTTAFGVTATDAAGNTSACAAAGQSFQRVEAGPAWRPRAGLAFNNTSSFATGEQGEIFALTTTYVTVGSGGRVELRVHQRASDEEGAAWSSPHVLTLQARRYDTSSLVTNARGDAAVVWQEGESLGPVRLARFDSLLQTWSEPVQLTAEGASGGEARAALDPQGNAVACWSSPAPERQLLCARVPRGESPGAPALIGPLYTPYARSLVLLADGRALLSWQRTEGRDGPVVTTTHLLGADGTWGTAPAPLPEGTFLLGGAPDGRAWATWSDAQGTWLRRFDERNDDWTEPELVAPVSLTRLQVALGGEVETVLGITANNVVASTRAAGQRWEPHSVPLPAGTSLSGNSIELVTTAEGEGWVFYEHEKYGPYWSGGGSFDWQRAAVYARRFRHEAGWEEEQLQEVEPTHHVGIMAALGRKDGRVHLFWFYLADSIFYRSMRTFR
ncbi:Ig-like domain-containing protein [Myxococcus sp. CA040A]|uniref:Ig-like domain-containing protein n=1 Tax=Myxococcus sp. CA040A TaxID=2741738 RepID=UPI00157B7F49|nr:Ig-like domain-containing protein [Myxococcus sp. CA040A]NTX07267.1 hypothetical protein [Myxococcus sp. CA040A]